MYSINTFWSANNMIAERKLQDAIDQQIQHDRKSKRYRRLGYYFFEREIQSDIRKSLESDFISTHHLLLDPEYQACISRSSLGKSVSGGIVWDDVTFVVNNYLFDQDVFVEHEHNDTLLSDQLIQILQQGNNPGFLNDSSTWMSDIVMQCRRTRDDIQLIQSIIDGSHTYKSLVKSCGEYIGKYAQLPRLFGELGLVRSPDALVSLLEESTQQQLQGLLQPEYQVICHLLAAQDIQAYGYVDIVSTPYSTWIGRLGQWWAHTAWYSKILVTIVIIMISGWFGGWTLVILPIVRGLLALSRSVSQYLELLKNLLSQRYTRYSDYNTTYVNLYDAMIDPDQSPKDSVAAQHTMTRRYDIIPFSGHELVWDATQYAKILYDAIMGSLSHGFESSRKDIAMISAVYDRGKNNNLSLLIVKDGQYPEQVLYRFETLLQLSGSLVGSLVSDTHYHETYDIIDEQISTKKYNFRFWTFRNAIMDGMTVAISSGVLGWMGSYLRNRSVTGTSAFAAGPGMVSHTITQSDGQFLFDTEMLSAMKAVMKPEDMTRFVNTIVHHGQSSTLWDTMVMLFGEKQGNIYTNNLMDHRWRIDTPNGDSALFDIAFDHHMPISSHDAGWNAMMKFLHHIYGYKNLQEYESLIDKPWLSNTLHGLQDGSLSLADFAKLDIQQREIVSQAMFYHVPQDSLSQLFLHTDSSVIDTGTTTLVQTGDTQIETGKEIVINVVKTGGNIGETGGIIETGHTLSTGNSNSLSLGQKILDILGWRTTPISGHITLGQTGTTIPSSEIIGDVVSLPEVTGTIVSQSGENFTGRWRQHFTGDTVIKTSGKIVETGTKVIENGDVVVNHTGSISSSGWMEHISSRWNTLTHPTYTIDVIEVKKATEVDSITGNQLVQSGSLTHSGGLVQSGSVTTSGWFEQFVTWIKGTAPVKTGSVDISGLVNTGQIEHVLSGINPDDIQTQVTGFTQQIHSSGSSWHISQFTFPAIKKDKKIE